MTIPFAGCWKGLIAMASATELSILGPALLAGLIVLSTHVVLGRLVLEKGIVFIDLAIAQVAGLGVVVADALGWEADGWRVQGAALAAALTAALVLVWTERRLGQLQEALIGVVFVVAASVEIIVLGFNPHGAEHLKDLLVGQIIWVGPAQLMAGALVAGPVLALASVTDLRRRPALFYGLFALCITQSVQLVGLFLVFASLILPALAAWRMPRPLLRGYGVGIVGYGLGLLASTWFDLPSGAAIVCTLAVLAGASRLRA
jgi:zinc/manganese transport system permease protein